MAWSSPAAADARPSPTPTHIPPPAVTTAPSPLALRLGDGEHAMEPGRGYLLGSDPRCDLVLAGTAPQAAVLSVHSEGIQLRSLSPTPFWHNGQPATAVDLRPGDRVQLGTHELAVVEDTGAAQIVPLPGDRLAARERRYAAIRIAAAAQRHGQEGFHELMAAELRRAPWLMLSVVLHLLLLLLLWLLLPSEPPVAHGRAHITLQGATARTEPAESAPTLPEVQPETSDTPPTALEPTVAEVLPPLRPEPLEPPPLRSNPHLGRLAVPAPSSLAPRESLLASASPGFRQHIANLRRSGLEIVFVFDSTGSMGRTILDTKQTIAVLLAVLRELVPGARVGIVTYRDEGPREAYVVRSLPLGTDYWRAANFVQSVSADGGGDRPEAVRQGLQTAFAMDFQPGARRVVVLAGDAPAHERDVAEMLAAVRRFAKDGLGTVHTLVTASETAGKDTQQHFQQIAQAGRGECRDLADYHQVLRHVLLLAFGREFAGDLQQMITTVEANALRTETWAMDLARRGGAMLRAELLREPVSHALLHALVRLPRRQTSLQLVDMLGDQDCAEPSRQAIAWVLQRQLDLGLPPVAAEAMGPPDARMMERLRRLARKLPE